LINDSYFIQARRTPWGNEIELMLWDAASDGRYVGRVQYTKIDDGALIGAPSVVLVNTRAQQLMDELWQCGLRPSEGTGSAGSLAATERHLNDMRRLVFEKTEQT
jgi:hypothetical protein